MLCSFSLSVSSFGLIDSEKPDWGSGNLGYLFHSNYFFVFMFLQILTSNKKECEAVTKKIHLPLTLCVLALMEWPVAHQVQVHCDSLLPKSRK